MDKTIGTSENATRANPFSLSVASIPAYSGPCSHNARIGPSTRSRGTAGTSRPSRGKTAQAFAASAAARRAAGP